MQKNNILELIEKSKQLNSEKEIQEFWKEHIYTLKDFAGGQGKGFEIYYQTVLDFLEELRGLYFMDKTPNTISEIYLGICQVVISMKIRGKDSGIENYLKYFNPQSSYFLRIKALIGFRLLNDPVNEIEGLFFQTCELLYQSVQIDSQTRIKAMEILKEYFDKLFSLKYTSIVDKRYRQASIKIATPGWEYRYQDKDFNSWFVNQLQGYVDVPIISNQDEEIKDEKGLLILQNLEKGNKNLEKKINLLEKKITDKNQEIDGLNKQIFLLKNNIGNISIEQNKILEEYEKLAKEKKDVENRYDEYTVLINEVEKGQKEIGDIKKENSRLKFELDNKISDIKRQKELTLLKKDNLKLPNRSLYRIGIILGSEHTNKKRQQIKRKINLYENYGLDWKQFEIIADYNSQKDIGNELKNSLIQGSVTMILAIQTDHETKFINFSKDSEICHQITINGEDKKYNGQSLSYYRFEHCLNLGLEKYERYINNTLL